MGWGVIVKVGAGVGVGGKQETVALSANSSQLHQNGKCLAGLERS